MALKMNNFVTISLTSWRD